MTNQGGLTNVSDTARWVAMYRAMESERDDALFRDPYARRLAGVSGESILNAIPKGRSMAWPMIVRTAVLDEIVMRAVTEEGVDTVLNLAAGLDTRPYRLPLPAATRWIDVDLPAMTEYKKGVLVDETPRCGLETVAADLADPAGRRAALQTLESGMPEPPRHAMVITEGLLVYLDPQEVRALATDLAAHPAIRTWLTDLATPKLLKMLEKRWGPALRAGNAPFRFGPAEGTAFFEPLGWKELEFRSLFEESLRLNRTMPFGRFFHWLGKFSSQAKQEETRRMSGIVVLGRA